MQNFKPNQILNKPKKTYTTKAGNGFTLLELIVVVAILVAVAGIGTLAMRNVIEDSAIDVTRAEMKQISQAVLKFKHDTGYYIGQGPFALLDTNNDGIANTNCSACTPTACNSVGAIDPNPPVGTILQAWLENPMNFSQLFSEPIFCPNHPLANVLNSVTFNSSSRGWNGPYIVSSEGVVSIQSTPDTTLANGNLTPGNNITNIPSLSDPFDRPDNNNFKFTWLSATTGTPSNSVGAPYMLFNQLINGQNLPRLVSAGRDGQYAGVNGTVGSPTLEQWCSPVVASDDIVLCF